MLLKMSSDLKVRTVAVLALICLFQCSVCGQTIISVNETDDSVAIRVRYDEKSATMINVTFSAKTFRSFYGSCMCKGAVKCGALYVTGGSLDNKPVGATLFQDVPDNPVITSPVYQCQNNPSDPYLPSLDCVRLNDTSGLPGRCVRAQAFRLNDTDCQSRCVTLVWFYEEDSITFDTRNISDLALCNADVSCPSTTTATTTTPIPTTTTSPTTTTANTTTVPAATTPTTRKPQTSTSLTASESSSLPLASSTTTNNNNNSNTDNTTTVVGFIPDEDGDADNTRVIIGVLVAVLALVIMIIIGIVCWRRRKNQGNKTPKNHSVTNSLKSFGLNGEALSADPLSTANSRLSEIAETAREDQSPTTPATDSQNAYSQLGIRDSNSYEHAYAAVRTDPYYNSVNGISTNSTDGPNFGTPSANSNTPSSALNSTSGYLTVIPSPYAEGSYACPDETATSAVHPSTQRNSYITFVEGVYSEAGVENSAVKGDSTGVSSENSNTQRNSYTSITSEPRTDGVYSEADVA